MEVGEGVDKNRTNYYKSRLEGIRSEEIKRDEILKENLRTSLRDVTDELSFYDNHPGDVGDTTFERGKDLGLKILTENKIRMIDDALNAIENGNYGICEKCGEKINDARLEAIPFTTLCKDCKKDTDTEDEFYRPIEEKVIRMPFGKIVDNHLQNKAYIHYDGEDAWQDVASFGTSNGPSDVGGVDDYEETYVNADEDMEDVEDFDKIPVKKDKDGMYYQDFQGEDDESPPENWIN